MIVAVAVVRVMQVIADEVVDVTAVRYRLMAAAMTVDVIGGVGLAGVTRVAGVGVDGGHGNDVLVVVVAVRVMQVAVVQIVEVAVVDDRSVAAPGAVHVVVAAFVDRVFNVHKCTVDTSRVSAKQLQTGLSRRIPRQSPTGWRTRNPLAERGAACQRVPALRWPEVSKRSPATIMYMWPRWA